MKAEFKWRRVTVTDANETTDVGCARRHDFSHGSTSTASVSLATGCR